MNTKPKWITLGMVTFLALISVAGTRLSRMTRTRTIDGNSRIYVITQDVSGRFHSRYMELPDFGTNLSQWSTNVGSGSSASGLQYDDGAGGGDELQYDE